MNDWNIQSRAHACQACENAFTDKQPYRTLLLDDKVEFRRIDVCESCWTSRYNQGATSESNVVSRWQGVYEAPPPAPPEAIQKETAETLLRKLIEQNDPKHGAACFILAAMLERKRLLKVKEQLKRDGKRVTIYEHPKTGDIFTIADPDLRLNQLDEVQRDVAYLLEHGLNPPQSSVTPGEAEKAPAPDPSAPPTEAAPDSPTTEPITK